MFTRLVALLADKTKACSLFALIMAIIIVSVESGGSFRATGGAYKEINNNVSSILSRIKKAQRSATLQNSSERSVDPIHSIEGASEASSLTDLKQQTKEDQPLHVRMGKQFHSFLPSPPEINVTDFKSLEKLFSQSNGRPPGYAIASLVNIDVIVLMTLVILTLPIFISPNLVLKIQGLAALITAILAMTNTIVLLFKSIVELNIMISLLLSVPFGTIVYMILYGHFDTTQAAAILSTVMVLKVCLAVSLLVASIYFLSNPGLVFLLGTSLIVMVIVGILHSFPPGILVSITDAMAAIIVCSFAILWQIFTLIGGVSGIIKAGKVK